MCTKIENVLVVSCGAGAGDAVTKMPAKDIAKEVATVAEERVVNFIASVATV